MRWLAVVTAPLVWLLDRTGRLDTGTPEQLALVRAASEQRAPAAGAGIALAGAVGVDLDYVAHVVLLYCSESRRLTLATGIGSSLPMLARWGGRNGRNPTTSLRATSR